jgi:hypothetical protein
MSDSGRSKLTIFETLLCPNKCAINPRVKQDYILTQQIGTAHPGETGWTAGCVGNGYFGKVLLISRRGTMPVLFIVQAI